MQLRVCRIQTEVELNKVIVYYSVLSRCYLVVVAHSLKAMKVQQQNRNRDQSRWFFHKM